VAAYSPCNRLHFQLNGLRRRGEELKALLFSGEQPVPPFLGSPYLESISQPEVAMSLMSAVRETLKQRAESEERFRFMSMFEYLSAELGESWSLFI